MHKKYMSKCIATPIIIMENWKLPECPATEKWLVIGYYATVVLFFNAVYLYYVSVSGMRTGEKGMSNYYSIFLPFEMLSEYVLISS